MKILLTHERFPPDFAGGGEEMVFQTARHLRERGAELSVLTTGAPEITEYRSIPTMRLPISRYRFNLAANAIRRAAADADLIHTFNYHACLPSWIAGRRSGTPVVCSILGLFRHAWREMRGPVVGRCFALWERSLLRIPYARTLFFSEYSLRLGLACGVAAGRAALSIPGLDPVFFSTPQIKDGSVLFAGKFDARKGVWDVLEVARALPEVRFRLVGWGPEEEAIRRSAPRNVEIVSGFARGAAASFGRSELAKAYAQAGIFLFPSRAETLGLVVLEAMASGCAIVSTVPLHFEGAAIRAGDVAGIATALQDLLRDSNRLTALGRRNVELARAYTWERYTDTLLRIYAEVIREAKWPRRKSR